MTTWMLSENQTKANTAWSHMWIPKKSVCRGESIETEEKNNRNKIGWRK